MAFTQNTFGPISSHGNSDLPGMWTYRTTDTSADVLDDQYFLAKHPIINAGDFTYVEASDTTLIGQFTKTLNGYTITTLVGAGAIQGNRILITKLEDFDNYDDTTVTLTTGFTYDLAGIVDIGTRCIVYAGSVVIRSTGSTDNILRSSCPTPMITGDSSLVVRQVQINNTVGDIYDITLAIPSVVVFDSFTHEGSMGQMTGTAGSVFFSTLGSFDSTTSPLTFNGSWTRLEFNDVFSRAGAIGAGGVLIEFDEFLVILERILINNSFSDIDATGIAYKFNGLTGIGNEAINVLNCNFVGDGTPITGATVDDNQTFFEGNVGLQDTLAHGVWRIENNVTPTPIAVIGVSVVIVGTVANLTSQRFTLDTVQNKLTYTGARARVFTITGTYILETSTSNQRIGVVVKVNGVDSNVAFTATTSGAAGSRIENLSVNGVLPLAPLDEVEVAVFNLTSTDDITVLDAEYQMVAL
jgi:hypothetical protein